MLVSQRKTGFLCFLVCIEADLGMAGDLVCGEDVQDESGSPGAVLRCRASRWRVEQQPNGVTVQICIQATDDETLDYWRTRKLHSSRDTEMLSNFEDNSNRKSSRIEIDQVTIARKYDLALRPEPVTADHDYCDAPNVMELSEFKSAAISYIAGYVVRMVQKKIHCLKCLAALTTTKEKIPDLFMVWKSNGGLKLPSPGLLKICEEMCDENVTSDEWWTTTRHGITRRNYLNGIGSVCGTQCVQFIERTYV